MAERQPRITTAGSRAAAVYALMIGALVLLYFWIRSYGDTLGAPCSCRQQHLRLGRIARQRRRPAARAARAGGGDRDRARDGLGLPQRQSTAGSRRNHRGDRARTVAARTTCAGRRRISVPDDGRALPQHHRAGRRHPLYVPGRARARPRAAAQTRAFNRRDLAREHHRAVPARRDDCALSLSQALDQRRAVHVLLAFPRRLDVGDRVSGARAES